jgi:hypothetical protein
MRALAASAAVPEPFAANEIALFLQAPAPPVGAALAALDADAAAEAAETATELEPGETLGAPVVTALPVVAVPVVTALPGALACGRALVALDA